MAFLRQCGPWHSVLPPCGAASGLADHFWARVLLKQLKPQLVDLHQGATRVAPGSGARMEGTHGLLGRRPGARSHT